MKRPTHARPTHACGYELDSRTLLPVRRTVNTQKSGDYGCNPLADGRFQMVPSGDVVDLTERNRRLQGEENPKP